MPLEICPPEDGEAISLAEYLHRLHAGRYDLSTIEGLTASAPLLKKLGNNKEFLFDFLTDQLRQNLNFQFNNAYGPEVFVLHSEPAFFLRANIWMPRQEVFTRIPGFRYDICHDHNFHILTIGYFGPGYESLTFEYDKSAHVGALGECLNLHNSAAFNLSVGKIAIYRAKHDIHIQLPPPQMSISLNLIPRTEHQQDIQFEVDEANGKILRYLDFAGSDAAVRIAGLVGGHDDLQVLAEVASTHPNPKVRALAVLAQMQIAPELAAAIEEDTRAKQSEIVLNIVKSELSRYGACMNYG
jgi:hypothetical protein